VPRQRAGSPNWFCDFYVNGKRCRDVIPDSAGLSRRQAEALERQIHAEKERDGPKPKRPSRAFTWGSLSGRWWLEHGQHLGWHSTVSGHLDALTDAIGERTPTIGVNSDLLSEAVAIWRSDLAPSTVNRRLAIAREVFYRARDMWGVPMPHVPWSQIMLEVPDTEPVYITPTVRYAILAQAAPHVRHAALIALCHGLRRSSVLRLRWEWHDFAARRFHTYGKSKKPGGKLIVLPITEEYLAILREIGIRDLGPVITYRGKPVRSISAGWRAAAERAGYPDVLFKDLRSSVGFEILDATGSLDLAGKTLAHSSPVVTQQHYARFQVEHVRAALKKRGRKFGHKDGHKADLGADTGAGKARKA
jgi:integrase